jgi:hypothetical protein
MLETERLWLEQLHDLNLPDDDVWGPRVVAVVANSAKDAAYWEKRVVASELYGVSAAYGIAESQPLGNLYGTIAAWQQVDRSLHGASRDGISFLSIVIGKGTRLSPFTQALGNRKAAFPTPRVCRNAKLGRAAISEVASWALRPTARTLAGAGFRGWIVKWGDEVILPDRITIPPGLALDACDVIRFASAAEPTDELAIHKEWLVVDPATGLLQGEIPRQPLAELRERLAPFAARGSSVSVNLGSFCATPNFFAALGEAFAEPLAAGSRGTDWDPWFWVAWCCADAGAWEHEKQREAARGRPGIAQVEARTPDFFARVSGAKARFVAAHGRPVRVGVIDLGNPLWVDYGNHQALCEHWNAFRAGNDHGRVLRALYGIPESRDAHGNVVARGRIEPGADVRDAMIVDAVVPAGSVIRSGIVIGGSYGRIQMPEGGAAIESQLQHLECGGPGAVSFRSLGNRLELEDGAKHTTLALPDQRIDLRGSDSIRDYSGASYTDPVLGNPISFEEAGRIMEAFSLDEIVAMRTDTQGGARS